MPPLSKHLVAAKGRRVLPLPETNRNHDGSLDEASIAALSLETLGRLPPVELIRIILSTNLPGLAPVGRGQLERMDMATLRRLASLARFSCCRHVDQVRDHRS